MLPIELVGQVLRSILRIEDDNRLPPRQCVLREQSKQAFATALQLAFFLTGRLESRDVHQVVTVNDDFALLASHHVASVDSVDLVSTSAFQDTPPDFLYTILYSAHAGDNVNVILKAISIKSLVVCLLMFSVTGCSLISRRYATPAVDGSTPAVSNPLAVPVTEMEFTWNQIVDMVDDYFEIASEQPVRDIGNVLMEGRIVTRPKTGATCAEFLMRDSTPGYERLHSTLQSIRRTAHIRVMPDATGFLVAVEVYKELEDVSQPEYSTVTAAVQRHDGSLVANDRVGNFFGSQTLGWIPLGRDESLEQEMLRNLYARMYEVAELAPEPPPAGLY